MPALSNPLCHSGYGILRRRQPKVKKRNPPAARVAAFQHRNIGLPRARGFQCETSLTANQFAHAFNQHTPSGKSSGFRIIRRDLPRYLIRVKKDGMTKARWNQEPRCSRFSRPIRPANDENFLRGSRQLATLRLSIYHGHRRFLIAAPQHCYTGCSSRFFFSSPSATGPCVSAVGGFGASPIRFE